MTRRWCGWSSQRREGVVVEVVVVVMERPLRPPSSRCLSRCVDLVAKLNHRSRDGMPNAQPSFSSRGELVCWCPVVSGGVGPRRTSAAKPATASALGGGRRRRRDFGRTAPTPTSLALHSQSFSFTDGWATHSSPYIGRPLLHRNPAARRRHAPKANAATTTYSNTLTAIGPTPAPTVRRPSSDS